MSNITHYFPETGHGGDGRRHGKSIEERELERKLRSLIKQRIDRRRNPPKTTKDEMAADLRYVQAYQSIKRYIANNTTIELAGRHISPARAALAKSVLRHKEPMSTAVQTLADMLGADEILEVRDGDISEIDGVKLRARVRYVPADPDSFWDPEHETWISPPKLRG